MAKEHNFGFLAKIDKNLYGIANDAEQLYCDEYFDQCMIQTRRFAENVCKNITNGEFSSEETFDEILATLKDRMSDTVGGREFINDLYFLKKAGNTSAHSARIENDGIKALECLQRAFEVAINFAMIKNTPDKTILSLQYDEELLITGKRSKEKTLQQKYTEMKQKETFTTKKTKSAKTLPKPKKPKSTPSPSDYPKPKKTKNTPRKTKKKKMKKNGNGIFFKTVVVLSVISLFILAVLSIMTRF